MVDKQTLRGQTLLYYVLHTIKNGIKKLKNFHKAVLFICLLFAFLLVGAYAYSCSPGYIRPLVLLCVISYTILASLAILFIFGYQRGARKASTNLQRVGFVNAAGEPPLLISRIREKNIITLRFWGRGFPAAVWQDKQAIVQTALNMYILSIIDGNDQLETVITGVPATAGLLDIVHWEPHFLAADDFVLLLGEGPAGAVSIDLSKIPHWLIAAATGMGKSTLLLLLLQQSLAKGAEVAVIDWKRGVSYPPAIRQKCNFVVEDTALQSLLDAEIKEMERRIVFLAKIGYADISEYNLTSEHPLPRRIIIVDETSMILDPTGQSKEGKERISVWVSQFTAIARLGRAAGIHLIMATQRPDVTSIPGALKANLDGRICGHVADSTSSQVILDDGSAADLPAVPGRFILRDGSGVDKIFQAYYC